MLNKRRPVPTGSDGYFSVIDMSRRGKGRQIFVWASTARQSRLQTHWMTTKTVFFNMMRKEKTS
jgi:hypothetical protein